MLGKRKKALFISLTYYSQHGALCIPVAGNRNAAVPSNHAEDCLFIDVYAPTDAYLSNASLPVYFFIQGGGFAALSNPNYNGSGLVQASGNNIVVVTFNYRVGPYGFLASKEIEQGASLNNGLKDQLKALKWVKKHISKVRAHNQPPESIKLTIFAFLVWGKSGPHCYRW